MEKSLKCNPVSGPRSCWIPKILKQWHSNAANGGGKFITEPGEYPLPGPYIQNKGGPQPQRSAARHIPVLTSGWRKIQSYSADVTEH
jgi:hypothetical protein